MTNISPTLSNALDELMEAARRHWGRAVGVAPELRLDLRGTSAGQASGGSLIRLNGALLDEHPHHWLPTLIHELAHILTQRLHPRAKPHGPQWRHINATLGGCEEVRHQLDVRAHRVRALEYFEYITAAGDTVWLSSIRHKRAQKSARRVGHSGYLTMQGVVIESFTGNTRRGPPENYG